MPNDERRQLLLFWLQLLGSIGFLIRLWLI